MLFLLIVSGSQPSSFYRCHPPHMFFSVLFRMKVMNGNELEGEWETYLHPTGKVYTSLLFFLVDLLESLAFKGMSHLYTLLFLFSMTEYEFTQMVRNNGKNNSGNNLFLFSKVWRNHNWKAGIQPQATRNCVLLQLSKEGTLNSCVKPRTGWNASFM